MADAGWGHGRPAEMDTGLLQVLTGYVTQGGQLYGARRWAENPLTLTHVRWQGPGGASAEAYRRPDFDDAGIEDDRLIWVGLALTVPPGFAMPSGGEAPWLPLAVAREQAMEWVQALRHARPSRQSWGQRSYGGRSPSWPHTPSVEAGLPRRSAPPFGSPPQSNSFTSSPPLSPPPLSVDTEPTVQFNTPPYMNSDDRQFTNSWRRGQMDAPEVAVLPCVDVELPPAMTGVVSSDYRRDFARDVALHFSRAARAIPQVREVRGWMRGDRMILAARFVVAAGNRPPSRAEMDGAAQILADTLAARTLPYARLGFADPGEWTQGAVLPE